MKMMFAFFAVLSTLLVTSNVLGQGSYPERAIRILVGFPSGGPPDIAARFKAPEKIREN